MLLQASEQVSESGMKAVCSLWLFALIVIVILFVVYVAVRHVCNLGCCWPVFVALIPLVLMSQDAIRVLLSPQSAAGRRKSVISQIFGQKNKHNERFWMSDMAATAQVELQSPAVPRSHRIAAALQPKLRTMLTKNRRFTQLKVRKESQALFSSPPRGDASDLVEEPLS